MSVCRPSQVLYNPKRIGKWQAPIPKPKNQRRNRNPKRGGEWVLLPEEGYRGPIPSTAGLGLSREAQQWWRTIWRSPMATQWIEADVPALIELAILRQRLKDGHLSIAPEVRLRSDLFGLTPAGRQQRRWIITEKDAERAGFVGDQVADLREKRAQRVGG